MKNNIFKSTAIYFVGNVLAKIILFFLLPLYTKYIPSADMGYYDTAVAIVTFMSNVLFLDIGSAIMRFAFEYKQDLETTRKIPISTGMSIFLFSTLIYILISLVVGLTVDIQYVFWVAMYGLAASIQNLYSYLSRTYGYNSLFAVSGVVNTLVHVLTNILFIIVLKWDYRALYISAVIGMLSGVLVLEVKVRLFSKLKLKFFDKALFIRMLKFSLPLCINSVAFWLLSSSNKLIVSFLLGTEATGYLSIANKFNQVLFLVSTCFQLAWQELAFSRNNKLEAGTGEFYTKAMDLYTRILICGLLLCIPLIQLGLTIFPSFIDPSYNDSIILIPLALVGTVMSIICTFLGSIFGGLKKTNVIFVSSMAGAIVNIGLIYGLIQAGMGVMAANIAFMVGFFVAVVIRMLFLYKEIKMKFKVWNLLVFTPIIAGVIFVYNRLAWYYNLIVFVAMLAVTVLVLLPEIKHFIKSLKARKGAKRIG